MVRSQLITMTNSTRLQERLFMEPDTCLLQKALVISLEMEAGIMIGREGQLLRHTSTEKSLCHS